MPEQFTSQIQAKQSAVLQRHGMIPQDGGIISPLDVNYFYFTPEWHIRDGQNGLITADNFNDLYTNPRARLLSVGAGPALLEETLVDLGIQPQQIHVADLDLTHTPSTFSNRYEFDMWQPWPQLSTKFDVIIFPESASSLSIFPFQDRVGKMIQLALQATSVLTDDGEIRMNGVQLIEGQAEEISQALSQTGIQFAYNPSGLVIITRIQ